MSITGYWTIAAMSYENNDYGYVNIATTWKGKNMPSKPIVNEKTDAMWSHQSAYGVIGSKVGDFIQVYGVNASLQEGIFTHRHIAEWLTTRFTGLKMNEIQWLENPLEYTLASGKPRAKKAKWLPEKECDIVHVYSDIYINVSDPQPITTDFFTAIRQEKSYENNWFMCNRSVKEAVEKMGYKNIKFRNNPVIG